MPDVVIMTDSNAGMTQEEGKKCGVEILPMSFIINGKICYEERDISHEAFQKTGGECSGFDITAGTWGGDGTLGKTVKET